MKILFDHPNPFLLAHGGFQTQIEQTKAALESIGVEVEYLRWWDDQQLGEIIHYFGRPSPSYIDLCHRKNIKVLMAPLLGGLGVRSKFLRNVQRFVMKSFEMCLPGMIISQFGWRSFRLADGCIALTGLEARLMEQMFGALPGKIHIVPNGVEPDFLNGAAEKRNQWLVCTATINSVKRVVELSQAAVRAKTPVWFIGKPYSESDPYAQMFFSIAKENRDIIRYEGPISDRAELARIYRQARGFVLLSKWESLSLSALEAAGCRCPLLLSDLPWSHYVFGETVAYCPVTENEQKTAAILRQFYDRCPEMVVPEKPKSWFEIAQELKKIYETLLKTS